jgi:diguanylate cyclase (GGDEF)-like protein
VTIQAIINNAIKRLQLEGKLLTPDFYAESFCKEATKAGMQVEDCKQLEKFTQMLGNEFQKELSNYRIKTVAELVRFLISKLNRTNPSHCSELLESQTALTKRILQAIEVLHNSEATQLAKKNIEFLEAPLRVEQLEEFRQRWINFFASYDDTFLQKLSILGKIDTANLKESIENLAIESKSQSAASSKEIEKISRLLVASFVPSIASTVNETIAELSQKIRNNPALLESVGIESEIKTAISLRIALDKESVNEMIKSIDGVLDKLSLRLIDMIERSDSSNEEIQGIKKELENYTHDSTHDLMAAHKKLYTIAVALEENTVLLSKDLRNHSEEVNALSAHVNRLEKELEEAKKESKEDFLTKLYNKRALDEFLEVKEEEFKRYERNYTVILFDLDKFKDVNDTFGHEAGDAVLSAFAKILKRDCRTVDLVGRYGGEEFLAILSETDLKGGATFAQKVREHVQNARFMYRGERIDVTVSCGVAQRNMYITSKATINAADEFLYKAKKEGRNRVEYKK